MATTPALSTDYRVTSINEAGNDLVNVSFTEVVVEGATAAGYGNFSRTFGPSEAAAFFPGQVYTMALTKKSATASS